MLQDVEQEARRPDVERDLGLLDDAESILSAGTTAMEFYTRAFPTSQYKNEDRRNAGLEAHKASAAYVFPSRLEEMVVLERAIAAQPDDARAPYYLGNFLYDRKRHREAIAQWERAVGLDPTFPTAWRNLGIAYFNVEHDGQKAREAFRHARTCSPDDARILYEEDQLRKRMGMVF